MRISLKVRDLKPGEVMKDGVMTIPKHVYDFLGRLLLHELQEAMEKEGLDLIFINARIELGGEVSICDPEMIWHKDPKMEAVLNPKPEAVARASGMVSKEVEG